MMSRRALAIVGLTVVTGVLVWLMFVALPRRYGPAAAPPIARPLPAATAPGVKKITARLFFVASDGRRLVGMDRDVPFGETPLQQAKEIVNAQIAPVTEPLLSAVPPGTTLRALFVTDRGEAYVDLSRQFATAHTGGTTDEILAVYTIVNALTANLPAIASVQVLIDGKEADTLAGHVDLRRPLTKNLAWVQ